jgi:Fe-S cluster biogenesis protein NfuA
MAGLELNDLNVNAVLDEIRPYVEADGGYLEYVAIDYLKEGPIVMVRMLGACAGCAMSAQTMTMGIEKLVMERKTVLLSGKMVTNYQLILLVRS